MCRLVTLHASKGVKSHDGRVHYALIKCCRKKWMVLRAVETKA